MTIAKYNKNLFASEVYRELERQEAKKGFFDPTDDEKIAIAAQQISEKKIANASNDIEETGNFDADVAVLASSLRERGFEKQATEVENNLVIYKQAQNALYGVTQETNKDFIDFAHRGGDFQVVPGDYGAVETVESAAEKILAVVRKEPTGKANKEASLGEIASLIKEAQLPSSAQDALNDVGILTTDYEMVNRYLQGLSDLFGAAANGQFAFTLEDPLHGKEHASALFNMLSGNKYQALNTYGALLKNLFQGGGVSQNTIKSNIINRGNQYLNTLFGGKYSIAYNRYSEFEKLAQYQYGYTPYVEQAKQEQEAAKEKAKREQQAGPIAQKIWNEFEAAKSAAATAIHEANTNLARYQADAASIQRHLQGLAERSVNSAKDYLALATEISRIIPDLKKRATWPIRILNAFGRREDANRFRSYISSLEQANNRLIEKSKNAVQVERSDKLDTKRVRSTLGRLVSIKKRLQEASEEYGMDVLDTINAIDNMVSIIRQRYGSGSVKYLLDGLRKAGFDYKTFQDLDNDTMHLASSVRKDIDAVAEEI